VVVVVVVVVLGEKEWVVAALVFSSMRWCYNTSMRQGRWREEEEEKGTTKRILMMG